MTNFQLEYMILQKEPTHQAKMKRCLDEMSVREKEIDAIKDQVEEIDDRIESISSKKEDLTLTELKFKNRSDQREIRRSNRLKSDLDKRFKDVSREYKFFADALDKYKKKEPLKDWDSHEVQLEYWQNKILQEIEFKRSMGAPIDLEVVRTAFCLPDCEVKSQLLSFMDSKKKPQKIN